MIIKRFWMLILTLLVLLTVSCADNSEPLNYTVQRPSSPYDDTMIVTDLQALHITPGGASILFRTETITEGLMLEWVVYLSDIFNVEYTNSLDGLQHEGIIETYPEGGTVYYRILQRHYSLGNGKGTTWFRLDLPRSSGGVLPPPYAPKE